MPEWQVAGGAASFTGPTLPGVAPSNVYPTRDGQVLIAANQDSVFGRLAAAMGQPELANDPRFASHQARGRHMAVLDKRITAWTGDRAAREVLDLLHAAGVPAGLVYEPADMLTDPHFAARRSLVEVLTGTTVRSPCRRWSRDCRTPPGPSAGPGRRSTTSTKVGHPGRGVGGAELETLRRDGVVGAPAQPPVPRSTSRRPLHDHRDKQHRLADAAATADRSLARLEAVLGYIGDGDLHLARGSGLDGPARPHRPRRPGRLGELERLRQGRRPFRRPGGDRPRRRRGYRHRPPSWPAAGWRAPAGPWPGCLPATDPAVLERTVEIPDLGTMTVAEWVPLIVGHLTGHVDQAFEVLAGHGALPEGLGCGRPSSTELHEVRVEDRPDPAARPGWVVVRVESASLCGTDAHQYEGRDRRPSPRVPGHDFAERVDSVGEGVEASLVGAPVAVKPSLPCRECADCVAGRLADCPRKRLMGLWSDGCMAEKVEVRESNLVPRPEGSRHGRRRCWSRWRSASTPSTGSAWSWARSCWCSVKGRSEQPDPPVAALSGAGRLIVTDAREAPFAVSRPFGATDCVNVAETDVEQAVADLTGGVGADVVIETSGFPASSAVVLDVVRKEGRIAHIGWANDLPPLPRSSRSWPRR